MTNPAGLADIGPTYVGTGNPPLSICDAGSLPFFPRLGALRFGRTGQASLFNERATLVAFRFNASGGYNYFAGFCGPSVALGMQWQGRLQSGTSTMTVSDDEIQAGFIFGVAFTLTLNFQIEVWSPTIVWRGWRTHISSTWNSVLNLSPQLNFDLISIIVDLLGRLAGARNFNRTEVALSGLGSARPWGVLADAENPFSAGTQRGGSSTTATVRPNLPIQVNIVSAIPGLNTITNALSRAGMDFTVGPILNLGFPVTMTLNNLRFSNGTTENSYTLTAAGGNTAGRFSLSGPPPAANLTTMTMNLTYQPSVTIGLGFGVSISFLSFASVGATVDVPFNIGVPVAPPTRVDLSNQLGRTSLAALFEGCGCDEEIGELFDVEFELVGS
jgi:hypothetical protein